MNKIALASSENRKQLFSATARKMNTTSAIIEKDFWVVWVLDKIFFDERLNKILMFKGGTSLSKVFDLIGRFSEDIDLILDWREVTKEDPKEERDSKTKQVKFNEQVNEDAKAYIKDVLLPIISEIVFPQCVCTIDKSEAFNINVKYPATFDDLYLRPQILLEIGPLASWLPYDSFEIVPYAAQHFSKVFERPKCSVNAIVAKRTFWEKTTILHQEAHRVQEKPLPSRYSRHYYDLAVMAKSTVKDEAIKDLELLKNVVEFKKKFYPSAWAKFDDATPGSLKLLPPNFRVEELRKDYNAMEHMIFNKYLTFEEIMLILKALEDDINSLEPTDD
ncbi:nucleotidyl transferase AbiEii/AbiGii toxin family protein [Sulfurimonas sp.]|uniref:nucleotidyl transferase AbiEii/AbiGii toxin family protein n=1 Tax=Sulfurimonas sp. TaxID=2022749 RepID=UPI001A01E2B4|nr:nucleotidyl transferase AbiEii/AbiGii toxin family protein [Sulfurimonas sp.]MBE0513418.1 nucleotidyl transferase AbiEii/AbiGii toxin family protein [Sulfurimonas sp.]